MISTFTFDFGKALQSQARLRLAMVGILVLSCFSVGVGFGWLSAAQVAVGALHLAYAAGLYQIQRRHGRMSDGVLFVTAVLDAVFVFGWVMVTGPYGILLTPLFNFSTIGYGMRTGNRKVLRVSQGASFVLSCAVPLLSPYWMDHMIGWGSTILAVVIVPWYAGELTKQFHAAIQFAERESLAKSELLARVSHELRTPLGGISNAAELLHTEAETDRSKQLSKTVLDLAAHLLADINDLLDQSKLTFGKMELSPAPNALERQVEIVRASIGNRASAKGLLFQTSIDPRVTSRVVVDDRWLSRVLINLAGNAVKFTDVGSVSLSLILLSETTSYYVIRFSVQDTGIGISAEDQDKIFDPFVQAADGKRSSSEGAGLGLAISYQAVQLMGGALRVTSTPGSGSHFWFDLRLEKAADEPAAGASAVPALNGDAPQEQAPQGKRILLVDDNSTNLFLLKELLVQHGHAVVTASSGEVALNILAGNDHFDLLLLDYNLGSMDGAQVLQTYRMGRAKPAPAYFLTADATLVTEQKLLDTGALGVLTKPIRVDALRDAIRRATEPAQSGQGTPATGAPVAASRPAGDRGGDADSAARKHLRAISVIYIDPVVIERLQSIGRSKTFLIEMLERAKIDINRSTDGIATALQRNDLAAARDAAHALKGVCMEIGAIRLANVTLAIMRSDDDHLEQAAPKIVTELRDTAANTTAALDRIITDQTRAAAGF